MTRNVKSAEASHIKIAGVPCQHSVAERARGARQLPALAEGVEVRKEKEIADPSEAHKGTRPVLTGGGGGRVTLIVF